MQCCAAQALLALVIAAVLAGASQADDKLQVLPHREHLVFEAVREWVDQCAIPPLESPDAHVDVGDTHAVCVLITRWGRILGRGVSQAPEQHDLRVALASRRALSDAIQNEQVKSLLERGFAIGDRLTIQIELASSPAPIPGVSLRQVLEQIEPGVDGIVIRIRNRTHYVFPSELLATDTAHALPQRIQGIFAESGLPAADLPTLKVDHGVVVSSFRSTHIVQRQPQGTPFIGTRGTTIIPMADVTSDSMMTCADGIARHLVYSLCPADIECGVRGTYMPIADRYEPAIAPPLDQMLVAYALAQYSEHDRADSVTASQAQIGARRILRAMARQHTDAHNNMLAVCALSLLTSHEVDDSSLDDSSRKWMQVCQSTLHQLQKNLMATGKRGHDSLASLSCHEQAIMCCALARLNLLQGGDERLRSGIESLVDQVWKCMPEHLMTISLLPWIGWAEADLAAQGADRTSSWTQLELIADHLIASQVMTQTQSNMPGDVQGGFVLTRPMGTRATSHSLRPWLFFADRDYDTYMPNLAARSDLRSAHRGYARFLMQLAVSADDAAGLENPVAAVGGLRSSPWTLRQDVGAQSMGLLTVLKLAERLAVTQ